MVDYTKSRTFGTNAYPVESKVVTNLFGRCEPYITPEVLISRYLKEIDLSNYSTDDLKREIEYAANEIELLSGLNIYAVEHEERMPYDRALYKNFVYMKTNHGPILSVEEVNVTSSNGEMIYKLPPQWIDMGQAHKRQLNIVPILSIFGATGLVDGQPSNAGLIFLNALHAFVHLPGFWIVRYKAGISHTEGQVPMMINDLIGMTTAIDILSSKQTANKYNSTSISQDGISQSASSAGTQIYAKRIEDLTLSRDKILAKIKSKFSSKYFMSNI